MPPPEARAAPRRRRWRRGRRRLAAGLALVAIGAAAGVAAAAGVDRLRPALVAALSARLGRPCALAGLSITAWPPALHLHGLAVAAGGEPPAAGGPLPAALGPLAAARIEAVPRLWPSWPDVLGLQRLRIEGLRAELSGAPAAPAPAATSWQLPVDVRHLELVDAEVSLAGVGRARLDAAAHPVGPGRRRLSLLAVVTAQDGAISARLAADGELAGSLARPGRLTLRHAHLGGGPRARAGTPAAALSVAAEGELAAPRLGAPLRLDLTVQTSLPSLAALVGALAPAHPAPPLSGGRGRLRLHVEGPLGRRLRGDGGLSAWDMVVSGRPAGELQADVSCSRAGVTLGRLDWQVPEVGGLAGSVDLAAAAGLPLTASLHLGRLRLAPLGLALPLDISGDLQAVGTLSPLDVAVEGELLYRALRLGAGPRPSWAPPAGELAGRLRLRADGAHVERLAWRLAPSCLLAVHGTVPWSPTAPLSLRGESAGPVRLEELGPLGGADLRGRTPLALEVAGTRRRPRLTTTFNAQDLRIGGLEVGTADGAVAVEGLALEVAPLRIALGGGELRGSLGLGLPAHPGADILLTTALEVAGVDAAAALRVFAVAAPLRPHLRARLSGSVALGGTLVRPAGLVHLRTPMVHLGPLRLGAARWTLALGRGDAFVHAHGTFQPPAGRLATSVAWRPPAGLDLCLTGRALVLAPLWASGAPGLDAVADIDVALAGVAEGLTGNISLIAERLRWGPLELDGLRLQGSARDGVWRPRLARGDGAPWGAGDVALAGDMPMQLRLHLPSIDVRALTPPGSKLAGEANIELALRGPLMAPRGIRGRARVDHLGLAYGGLAVRAGEPFEVRLAGGRLRLGDGQRVILRAAPPLALALGLRGWWEVGGPLSVRANLAGDLGFLPALVPQIAAAHGAAATDLEISGPPGQLAVRGDGQLSHVGITWSDHAGILGAGLEALEARWLLAGRRLELTAADAAVGEGHIWMLGEAQLGGAGSAPRLNLQANLKHVPVHPAPDLDATVTGDLQLAGPIEALALDGRLNLDSLRYNARLDLERLLPARGGPPLKVASLSRLQPVRFGVHMVGRNNLLISGNVLDAELQGDLMLTGTSERVGLLGSMTSLWARARYRDNLFVVGRASIDFLDEHRIAPEINVQAETRACNMLAEVTLNGGPGNLHVLPRGQDERGVVDPQDVLSCLQFGLRLNDFGGNQRTPASFGDALPGSLDALWTVSGLDDKVKKLLPIDVDELRLTSGWSSLSQRTTARVLVGKQLGSAWTARYSRSLDEYNDQSLTLEHRLGARSALQAAWLSVLNLPLGDFGADLRLHWELP